MVAVSVSVFGIQELQGAFNDLGPGPQARLLGPALGRMANVLRRFAARRSYIADSGGFNDRRRLLSYPERLNTGRYKDLRASIRARRIVGTYGGRRYPKSRAAVFAGGRGSGAAQAHLVEAGHGGPRPAPPRRYLYNAVLATRGQQSAAFQVNMRRRMPQYLARISRKTATFSAQHSFARTVSRRARSRR